MTEQRRYNEQEISEILERAVAEESAPGHAVSPRGGLTLSQLKEIGSEVGISPERIARAAQGVGSREVGGLQKGYLGAPRSVSRIVPLERPLTDGEWDRLVVDLRETFDAVGTVRILGPLRSWSNGNLQVHVEPDGDAYRVRMKTTKGNTPSLAAVGGTFLTLGIILFVLNLVGDAEVKNYVMSLFFGLAGVGQLGYIRASLPGWARERASQMEGLAERLPLPEKE